MCKNLLFLCDSYKVGGHFQQYPQNTTNIYSYFESRGGRWKDTVFFGLQYILKKYLVGTVVTASMIDEAEELFALHFGRRDLFNRKGWEYIVSKYDGRLPLTIRSVPEGSATENHNVLMTVENTDPECFWLTNYLETLLVQCWYPCTVATQSREMKKIILKYLQETGDTSLIDYKLHCFGFRGVSSVESAGIGGLAHLVNFKGSDTLEALVVGSKYYNEKCAGNSIPASEHSTITAWGKDNEVNAYRNILEKYPTGLVACVSDSYDIYNACDNLWGGELKDMVMARDGCLIVRPDSSDPVMIVTDVVARLGNKFGYTINNKGYKVLDPHVRVIQGDGIEYDTVDPILARLKKFGWSTDNISFGSGGGLLQKLNRDTLKFAFKCSSAVINGNTIDVYKDPITDSGKRSKRGRLKLVYDMDGYTTVGYDDNRPDCLVEVFRDGKLLQDYSMSEIRERAKL